MEEILVRLINYTFKDTEWEYSNLTLWEKEIVKTQENLDKLKEIAEGTCEISVSE
jgi:hypothetical protein